MEQFVKDIYKSVDNAVRSIIGQAQETVHFKGNTGLINGNSVMRKGCCGSKSRTADLWGCYTGAATSCRNLIRIGGFSAAAAVAMAAYGAHVIAADEWRIDERRKKAFDNGSKHHLMQSIGLLLSHKAKYPIITAVMFTSGIVLFCGPCYMYGIWNNERFRRITPTGGVLFILGWLSFML